VTRVQTIDIVTPEIFPVSDLDPKISVSSRELLMFFLSLIWKKMRVSSRVTAEIFPVFGLDEKMSVSSRVTPEIFPVSDLDEMSL
jgi:hypothetical protein